MVRSGAALRSQTLSTARARTRLNSLMFSVGRQSFHALFQNRGFREGQRLPHNPDSIVFWNRYGTLIPRFLPHNHPEEGRFPMAVPTHQAHPFPGAYFETGTFEKFLSGKAFLQVFYLNHSIRNRFFWRDAAAP